MTLAPRQYRVGEIVLMDYMGWLKAFRVVEVNSDVESIEYRLQMVEMEKNAHLYQWQKPARDD